MSVAFDQRIEGLTPELESFAVEHQVVELLPAVVELTTRIFPVATIQMELRPDPEIADFSVIVVVVEQSHLNSREMVVAIDQWYAGCWTFCPSPDQVLNFVIDVRD